MLYKKLFRKAFLTFLHTPFFKRKSMRNIMILSLESPLPQNYEYQYFLIDAGREVVFGFCATIQVSFYTCLKKRGSARS